MGWKNNLKFAIFVIFTILFTVSIMALDYLITVKIDMPIILWLM